MMDLSDDVVKALRENDVSQLRSLFAKGNNPHATSNTGGTYLMFAAEYNAVDCIRFLKESAGCDVNAKNMEGNTALSVAACKGKFLATEVLLSMPVNINHTNCLGRTPLMLAVCARQVLCVKQLISAGAVLDLGDAEGTTAVMFAIRYEHSRPLCLEILLRARANANLSRPDMSNALTLACSERKLESLKMLLHYKVNADAVNENGRTCVMEMAALGLYDFVEVLVEASSNVSIVDKDGDSALSLAVAKTDNWMCVQRLLLAGANVNHVNPKTGETPLMLTATKDDIQVLEMLYSHGAHVNAKDFSGRTALIKAMTSRSYSCVQFLLEIGVPLDSEGKEMIFNAIESDDVDFIRNMLEAGTEPHIVIKESNGRTAMMTAAINGRGEILRLLLEAGRQITQETVGSQSQSSRHLEMVDNCGETALSLAVSREDNWSCVDQLLRAGANAKIICPKTGQTLLLIALSRCEGEVVETLARHGADVL